MKNIFLAIANWAYSMAAPRGPHLSTYRFYSQLSSWWLTCHPERNQSCMTNRPDCWEYVKDWECGWYWMSDEGEIQE